MSGAASQLQVLGLVGGLLFMQSSTYSTHFAWVSSEFSGFLPHRSDLTSSQ